MKKIFLAFMPLILAAVLAPSQPEAAASSWEPFRFLLGQWSGAEESAPPSQGKGLAVFQFELDGNILMRRNLTDFPAAAGRPAFRHQDLLIVFPEAGAFRAIYFDNEGHVIRYALEIAATGGTVTFLSETAAGQPRFRLAYSRVSADQVKVQFAIAPPGKPDEFMPYLEALTRRKN